MRDVKSEIAATGLVSLSMFYLNYEGCKDDTFVFSVVHI